MIKPDMIIRTNRKTLSLTISKQGELIVRAPKKLSLEYIFNFIKQKERWINQKRNQINNINSINQGVLNYDKFMFLGKLYNKVIMPKIKHAEIYEDDLLVPYEISLEKELVHVEKWYKKMAHEILKSRVAYFSDLMQLSFETCSIFNAKNRWGSCDINGNLKFNYRIAMLPHKIIDYIIIHELAHLIEFNHSPNFYKIIESIMPDYKKQIVALKHNSFILQLLR